MDVYTAVPHATFHQALQQVHRDIQDVREPGQCYVSTEVDKNLQNLHHGMKHVQLDDTFLRDCPQWRQNFPMRQLAGERAAVVSNMRQAHTFLEEYKFKLGRDQVNNMMDNQVREAHHWATESAKAWHGQFDPLANRSQQRINQFCDWIGVTDRYTGYRSNLTRFHSSLDLHQKDRDMVPTRSMERFNLPKQATLSHMSGFQAGSALGNGTQSSQKKLLTASMSKQEQAGINLVYPGSSEYVDRYRRPARDNVHNYQMNPIPDFSRTGRTVAKVEHAKPESEYTNRYLWTARVVPNQRSVTFA